eukprot:164609-Chlamydomonas_euryale.AAC.1
MRNARRTAHAPCHAHAQRAARVPRTTHAPRYPMHNAMLVRHAMLKPPPTFRSTYPCFFRAFMNAFAARMHCTCSLCVQAPPPSPFPHTPVVLQEAVILEIILCFCQLLLITLIHPFHTSALRRLWLPCRGLWRFGLGREVAELSLDVVPLGCVVRVASEDRVEVALLCHRGAGPADAADAAAAAAAACAPRRCAECRACPRSVSPNRRHGSSPAARGERARARLPAAESSTAALGQMCGAWPLLPVGALRALRSLARSPWKLSLEALPACRMLEWNMPPRGSG